MAKRVAHVAAVLVAAFASFRVSEGHRVSATRFGALSNEQTEGMEALLAGMSPIDANAPGTNGGHTTPDKLKYDVNTPAGATTVIALLEKAAEMNGDKYAFRSPKEDPDGNLIVKPWRRRVNSQHTHENIKMTWKEYYEAVLSMANAFVSAGLQPMDAVNIRGINSNQWLITFLGCIAAGGLPVGLYPTDSPEALKYKAINSGAKFVVLGKLKDLRHYATFKDELPDDVRFIVWDKKSWDADTVTLWGDKLVSFDHFMDSTKPANDAKVKQIISEIVPGQAATVVYTSGTTSDPKGVMLSHDGVTWSASEIVRLLHEFPADGQHRIMSYLPLNHVAGQMLDIIGPLYMSSLEAGKYVTVYFPATCYLKKKCLKEQLVDAQPTVFLGVPAVWDALMLKMEAGMAGSAIAGFLKNLATGGGVLSSFARGKILSALGLTKVIYSVSGAGALASGTLKFYHGLGLKILNMYAQSESSALGTAWKNSDFDNFDLEEKAGSIGKAVGNEVRIDPENDEIQLKGRNVMLGYLNNEKKTNSAFTQDGWLKTGDAGRVDKDGFYFLTGRLKDIMKDYGGEMIAPQQVELGLLKTCQQKYATQVIVVGDGKYYLSALFTIPEYLKDGEPSGDIQNGAAKDLDPAATTIEAAQKSEIWMKHFENCIGQYNSVAAKKAERVYRFAILPQAITPDHSPDLMTPTQKIKRPGVAAKYADVIESCGGTSPLTSAAIKPCGM